MDQPVAPAARIINREGTDERGAGAEGLEHEPLRRAEPEALAHGALKRAEVHRLDPEWAELGRELDRIRLLQEREQRLDRESVEDLDGRIGAHDVEERRALDMAVAALIEIE